MQVTHLEKIFYHYIDSRPEVENIINARFFETPEIKEAFEIRKEFRSKYHKTATSSQMKEIARLKGADLRLTNEKIDALYEIDLQKYDPQWLQETTEAWVEFKNLDVSIIDLVSYMKTTKINSENIKDVVQTAKSIILDNNNIDFKFDDGLDFFNPESHKQYKNKCFSTGYPFFDYCLSGGFAPKTLVVWAGVPKSGKCAHRTTIISVRNRITGEIEKIDLQTFFKRIKFLEKPANI